MSLFAAKFAAVAPCPEEHGFTSVGVPSSNERAKPGNSGVSPGQRYHSGYEAADQQKEDEEEARQRRKREGGPRQGEARGQPPGSEEAALSQQARASGQPRVAGEDPPPVGEVPPPHPERPSQGDRQPAPPPHQFSSALRAARNRVDNLLNTMKVADANPVLVPNFVNPESMPFLVPKSWPLNLIFFRKVYVRLLKGKPESEQVSLDIFRRSMERMWTATNPGEAMPSTFDHKKYDDDNDGGVSWREFCECWRDSYCSVNLNVWERLYICFDPLGAQSSKLPRFISMLLMVLILISSTAFVVSTLPHVKQVAPEGCGEKGPICEPKPHPIFGYIESCCVVPFTIEFLARFLTVHSVRLEFFNNHALLEAITGDKPIRFQTPCNRMIMFCQEPSNLIDVLAILPFYMELLSSGGSVNLYVLRLIRLTRIFRILRLGKLNHAKDMLAVTMSLSKVPLYMVLFFIALGILISSCLVYFVEMGEWNGEFYVREGEEDISPFSSIPATIWWTVVTVTTVGYGDYAPTQRYGFLFGSFTIIGGVIAFALPIGIMSSNFDRAWAQHEKDLMKDKNARAGKLHDDERAILQALEAFGIDGRAQLRFEVYDYEAVGSSAEFLGAASIDIRELGIQPGAPSDVTIALQLNDDPSLAKRKAHGIITARLKWEPINCKNENIGHRNSTEIDLTGKKNSSKMTGANSAKKHNASLQDALWAKFEGHIPPLIGCLNIQIVGATGLKCLDCKVSDLPDPFARVILCPQHNVSEPEIVSQETEIIFRTSTPEWNNTMSFNLDWRRSLSGPEPSQKQAEGQQGVRKGSKGVGGVLRSCDLEQLKELQAEVQRLRAEHNFVPKAEIPDVPNAPRSTQITTDPEDA
eukprot:gnl/MRDRNA2_/MRDRNA2_111359_c0_seq1.p1 gnl/MRDRNA2_/MRDRNA2_111359_c0~~gnl/MRDRNA2_/MRDRNA2_111359_c0_seq1.p1  ORF type:complete len:867 (+),score=141.03 gnl/MRDRNA2_/MRDRNA2_111359_c0_seq1:112-2712(+)